MTATTIYTWDISATVNSKLRRWVGLTQITSVVATDFTSSDRTMLTTVFNVTPAHTPLVNTDGTIPDTAGTTTLLARLSAARATYLDNLNRLLFDGSNFVKSTPQTADIIVYTDPVSGLTLSLRQAIAAILIAAGGPTTGFGKPGNATAIGPAVAPAGVPSWSATVDSMGNRTNSLITPPI